MKDYKFWLIVLLTINYQLLTKNCSAQSAYHGGSGDGYSKASINLQGTNIKTIQPNVIEIYPNIISNTDRIIQIKNTSSKVYEIKIITIDGQEIFHQNQLQGSQTIRLPQIATGQYFLNLIHEGHQDVFTDKITFID